MLLCDFLWDEAEHCGIDIEEIEIDGRNAVLPRENGSDHVVGDKTQFHEIGGEAAAVFARAAKADPPAYALLAAIRANQAIGRASEARRLASEGARRFPSDPVWTQRILDILKQENVKACFFVVGENGQASPSPVVG